MAHTLRELHHQPGEFGADNSIQSFAASFEQHCEGQIPALFGTFTYNAVPEPSTLSLFACVAVVGILAWHKPQGGGE